MAHSTICSAHNSAIENIKNALEEYGSAMSDDFISHLESAIGDIETALSMGERMEAGLVRKKEEIESLNQQI